MDKLNIIHVVDKEKKLTESIFLTMAKSFEITSKELYVNDISKLLDEQKIHIVIFDNIDYEQVSLDITNALKDKHSHIHLVMITNREDEKKQMRILHRRIDNIWEASYSEEYFRTVFRALLTRMSKKYILNKMVSFGDITVDRVLREVKYKDKFIDLTGKEYKVFHELISLNGYPISKQDIYKKVWNLEEDLSRTVDQYLHRIKKKIENLPFEIIVDKMGKVSLIRLS